MTSLVALIVNLSAQLEYPNILSKDLEDFRKTGLNVLAALLPLQSTMGSTGSVVTTLALMLYTTILQIVAIAGASHPEQLGVVTFAILHAILAVGTFVITSVQLALAVNSPTAAVCIIIMSFLPATVTIAQYLRITISGEPADPSA